MSDLADSYRAAADFRVALLGFQRRTVEITARHGLTPQRYLLLLLVRVGTDERTPPTVTTLCEPLQMTQSAVTQLAIGAETAGLVDRVPDPDDARSHTLRLTTEGSRRLRNAFSDLREERLALLAVIEGHGAAR